MEAGEKFIFLIITMPILFAGCIPLAGNNPPPDISIRKLSAAEYSGQIEQLLRKSAAPDKNNPALKVGIHRDLARLYLSPHNPKRDSGKAAAEIEKLLKTTSIQSRERDEAENMLAVLNEIDERSRELAKLQAQLKEMESAREANNRNETRISELARKNNLLQKRQEELLAENKKLETTIEKLKFLDLNLEKKRRSFR